MPRPYSRAKGIPEAVAATALADLNKLTNEPFMAYLKRKLGEWYSDAPRPARKQLVVDTGELGTRASRRRPRGSNRGRRPSGGGDGGGLVID
jgi:hypothetical protein